MGTISREFYGEGTTTPAANDGAYGTDIRKLFQAAPAQNTNKTTRAQVNAGSGTNAEIVWDPITTRTALGVVDALGWAVNFSTADGMQSIDTAKRRIAAGAWRFRGQITPPAVAENHRIVFRVYRVATAPGRARTLLFTFTSATRMDVAAYNFDYTTVSQDEITLEADESIQVSPAVIQNANNTLASQTYDFTLGSGALGEFHWQVTIPAPGVRTFFPRSFDTALSLVVPTVKRDVGLPRTAAISLAAPALVKRMTLARVRQVAITLGVTFARTAQLRRVRTAAIVFSTTIIKTMRLPRAAALSLAVARSLRVGLPRSVALVLSAALTRRALALKRAAALTLTTTMTRALTLRRAFGTTFGLTAKAFAKMAVALIPAGGAGAGPSRTGVLRAAELALGTGFVRQASLHRTFSTSLALAAVSGVRPSTEPSPDPLLRGQIEPTPRVSGEPVVTSPSESKLTSPMEP